MIYFIAMSTPQRILSYIVIVAYFGAAYYVSAKICMLIAKRYPKLLDTILRNVVIWGFFIIFLIPVILWVNNNL